MSDLNCAPFPRPPLPFLRWAGSKRQQSALIASLWRAQPRTRYVEPFVGSAAVFFAIQPPSALLSDLNAELARALRTVRDHPSLVAAALACFRFGREEYYKIREAEDNDLSDPQRAARFIYLNRFCFNGLYRTNRQGRFNVPYGAPKTMNLPTYMDLGRCSGVLKNAEIVADDFRVILDRADPGDFYYLDPPYAVHQRRVFRQYGAQTFSAADLSDLSSGLTTLDHAGVLYVLSYADCREGRLLAVGRKTRRLRVRRHVAGFSTNRRIHYELLISNHPQFESLSSIPRARRHV